MTTEDNTFGVQLASMLNAASYETRAAWLDGTKISGPPGSHISFVLRPLPESQQFLVIIDGEPLGGPFKLTGFDAEVKDSPLRVEFTTDNSGLFHGQVLGPNATLTQAFPQDFLKAHCEESKNWPVSCAAFGQTTNELEQSFGIALLVVGSVLAVLALVLGPLFNSVGYGVGFAVPAAVFIVFGALAFCQVF